MSRNPLEIAEDCAAMSVVYSEACAAHAAAEARHQLHPDDDRLYARAAESRVAMRNCFDRLLRLINELRDAGAGPVADNINFQAARNATLASEVAFGRELAEIRGAA